MTCAKSIWMAILAFLMLSACADLNSISRRTRLPPFDNSKEGQAIHLDVKQRLVVANGKGDVCAEPSPDALSAYASALSGGVSVPSQGAGSAAGALQESAASIGLRTQSITLMRDALYRLCEAYYNGQLSKAQVMLLLSRSQDLTATIVAVEQLTGAVVAQQAALSGAAGASSSASLVSNTKALEQMQELQKKKTEELGEATKKQGEAHRAQDDAKRERDAKQQQIDGPPAATGDDLKRLQGELGPLKDKLAAAEETVKQADTRVDLLQKQLADIDRVIESINTLMDSALTSASATASGTAVLGTSSSRGGLSLGDASVDSITAGVRQIVTTVLSKKYIVETCTALLTNPKPPEMDPTEYSKTLDLCYSVIKDAAKAESEQFQQILAGDFGTHFQSDTCSDAIRGFWKPGGVVDTANRAQIDVAMRQAGVDSSLPSLLNSEELSSDRRRVGAALGLSACK